jgi:phytoene/squalene synthetase
MNISRSHAVDTFRHYGRFWYKSAQKLPIDVYKDIILFYEFIEHILKTSQQHRNNKEQLIIIIQSWHEAYHSHNINHPDYGPCIEMMYRHRIDVDHMKAFLQSMLLHTIHIDYQDEDQIQAYIYGSAEAL